MDAGWLPELLGDEDDTDASMKVGMDDGPASGHTNLEKAKLIGMPRHYGYGSSIGSWALDYVTAWAGDGGFIRHSKVDYRAPVFEGDLAILHGEVRDQRFEPLLGVQLVTVDIRMVNQDDVLLARGFAEVELPEA
jgi:acyl dehydratase